MVYYIHTYNQVPRQNETRSKDEHFYGIKPDVSINVPFYAVGYAPNPKENRKDKVYSPLAYKCRFIGYAIDVNWTNTPQISKANESNFVNYKDSNIILINGTRYIRQLFLNSIKINQQYSKLNRQIAIRPIPNRTPTILMRSTFKNSITN